MHTNLVRRVNIRTKVVVDAQNDSTLTKSRTVDLEVDIGADAVDYKSVAKYVISVVCLVSLQCHCKPRVFVWAGDRNAEAGGCREGDR